MPIDYFPHQWPARFEQDLEQSKSQWQSIHDSTSKHMAQSGEKQRTAWQQWLNMGMQCAQSMATSWVSGAAPQAAMDWAVDTSQRSALMLDILRQRSQVDEEHAAAGAPPVLNYPYTTVCDGSELSPPVNYRLVRILPPENVPTHEGKRPYMIIDPRAGHGAGIGGFKIDSQVGVALQAHHPVYFVVFDIHPVAGQTLADVMHAEAHFVRTIEQLHPSVPKPVVVGNCQGGWATLLLAASHPDICGPIVINGAPVSTWSGQSGEHPMRFNGGLLGGALPALMLSDLGAGEFDGAHLVSNFEMLNPSRNWVGKYADLFQNIDDEKARASFLEFEKWWGGYHFNNEAEMNWIVQQLFIGNKLARGQAQLEPGRTLDLRNIRSPIIVFASKGDNITPPQQALGWITQTWTDEREIRIRGQRIIYMVHDKVGHLGIFVSSSVARKEHTEMASALKTLESLTPGLYEMCIVEHVNEEGQMHFEVSYHERKMHDLQTMLGTEHQALDGHFAAVSRLSELGGEIYSTMLRPLVQSTVTPEVAQGLRNAHPGRLSRQFFAESNPFLSAWANMLPWAKEERRPVDENNPWLGLQQWLGSGLQLSLDAWRDSRDAAYESAFLSIYGSPYMQWLGQPHLQQRQQLKPDQLRQLPEVQDKLINIDAGSFASGVIRMLILLADSRGSVRRDRLERSYQVLQTHPAFVGLSSERRSRLINEQAIIIEFERPKALSTLGKVLPTPRMRQDAMAILAYVLGDRSDITPASLSLLVEIEQLLGCALPSSTPDAALAHALSLSPMPEAPPAASKKVASTSRSKIAANQSTLQPEPPTDPSASGSVAGQPATERRRRKRNTAA